MSWMRALKRRFGGRPALSTHDLLFLGDSHLEAFKHAADNGLIPNNCSFVSVGGATAIGLRNPNSATDALKTFRAKAIPALPNTIPIIHLGEVDCGFVIWWRAKKHGEAIESQMSASIAAYFEFVDLLLEAGYPSVLITGATVPTIRDGADFGEVANKRREVDATLLERTRLTLQYNRHLEKGARARRVPYVDIAGHVLDPRTGTILNEFRNTNPLDHHLAPEKAGPLWADQIIRALRR